MSDNKESSKLAEFAKDLAELGLDESCYRWLYNWAVEQWESPSVKRMLNVDDEELYEYLIDATAEACKYRPTIQDLMAASSGGKIISFLDLVHTLKNLYCRSAQIGKEIDKVSSDNCCQKTRELWAKLTQFERHQYNDQFAIKCLLSPRYLYDLSKQSAIKSAINQLGKNFTWRYTSGVEKVIEKAGGIFERFECGFDIRSRNTKPGDIIKIASSSTAEDSFVSYVIAGEHIGGELVTLEFKFLDASPFRATVKGFEAFFLRDPETRIAGIWKLAPSGDTSDTA